MSQASVEFHPEATAEAAAAVGWYAERNPDAAARFEAAMLAAVERVAEGPARWPSYDERFRKLRVRGFPYVLIYRADAGRVLVVAVAHTHRRPGYWRSRA